MISKQYQIRLTDEVRKKAQGRADELGLTLAGYIKYLIAQDIKGRHKPLTMREDE